MNTGNANDDASLSGHLAGEQDPEAADEPLLRDERKLFLFFSQTSFAVALSKAPSGVLVDVNKAWVELFGYTRQEAIGKTTLELNIDTDAEAQARILAQIQQNGSAHDIEVALRTKSGQWRTFLTNVDMVGIGGQTYMLNTVQDITERKQAEEQLERSNQKLNEILNSIQDDFYVLDRDWNFVYASRLFTSKVGKEPEDFVGNNIWKMFPKHVGTAYEENLRAAMEEREVRSFEIPGKYTDAWYRMKAFPSAEGITVLGTDITEQNKAEENLHRFELLSEHGRDIILFMRREDGRLLEVNAAAIAAYGYSHDELLTLTIFDLRPPNTRDLAAEQMIRADAEGILFETVHQHKDGRTFPVEVSSRGATINGVRTLISIVRDITERKLVEDTLRDLSKRLTYHVDNSPLAVVEWGSDMRIIRWSGAAERIFGWKAKEVLGKRIEDLHWVYEEDFQQVNDVSTDLQTGINPRRFSANRNYRKDGSIVYCEWYNSSLMDESGHLRSILSLVLDVTDRTRMERELAKSEERYRHLVKHAPTGIYEIDLKTMRFIEVNDSMCRILGYTREELLAMMPDELLNEEGRQRFRERMWKALAGETVPQQTEYIVKAKDGHEMWGLLTTTINYDNGKPRSVSVVAHDITERKRAEDALRKNEEKLQLLNETLEQKVQEKTEEVRSLASNLVKAVQRERQRLSHILHDDLQQRIYAIQMQLSFLRDDLPTENEAARAEVSDIEQQLGEIRKITRDLSIDLSPPILHDEGLAHALHWLASQMRQQYGLEIELQANEAFVIPDEELHVLLFNSVRELLFNVVKHAEASCAVVVLQWSNGALQIEVCDDGKGFPVNMLEKSISEEMRGDEKWQLGFGLSTIRHQLSLFGGSMEIESKPGGGARILLIVPVVKE